MYVFGVCELCEDCMTRLYSKNDRVDTAQPEWRQHALFAAFHHERSNQDTSLRIKRSLRNRFMIGNALRRAIYGYIKPEDAEHDSELSKDPAAEPIFKRWFEMLDDGGTFEDVVVFLKEKKVRFPARRRDVFKEPDAKSVARITFNPILKGVREHNPARPGGSTTRAERRSSFDPSGRRTSQFLSNFTNCYRNEAFSRDIFM